VWSPDGSRIAFSSDRDGDFDIYVIRADGGRVRHVTRTAGVDRAPTWSPDGTLIAFEGGRASFGDRAGPIEIASAVGTARRLPRIPLVAFAPAWSPDGARIAIGGKRAGARHERVFVVDVATGSTVALAAKAGPTHVLALRDRARVTPPAWSPDSRTIAFAMGEAGDPRYAEFAVVVADADGGDSELVRDAHDAIGAFDPVWSHDGELLAFLGGSSGDDLALYSWRRGGYEERDCNDVRRLTPYLRIAATPGGGETLAWEPAP
jgi:TolB protein